MKRVYYFLLSGSYYGLSEGELDALLEIYNIAVLNETHLTQIRVIEADASPRVIRELTNRSGSIKEAGEIIAIHSLQEKNLVDKIVSNAYNYYDRRLTECWIDYRSIKGFGRRFIEEFRMSGSKKICSRLNRGSENKFSLITTDQIVLFGRVIGRLDSKGFMERRPSTRPFFRSIALSPQLSRILVNLSRLRPRELFLDPFCGTGSLLIEAYLVGGKPIGIDINWDIVKGARKNMEYYGILGSEVVLSDARTAKIVGVDAVATDPPYGRSASTYGEDVRSIYRGFIENVSEILSKRRYIVFLAPLWLEEFVDKILCDKGFVLKRKYYMYVHSGLTRIVYEAVKI